MNDENWKLVSPNNIAERAMNCPTTNHLSVKIKGKFGW